jgi:hypothetical protein
VQSCAQKYRPAGQPAHYRLFGASGGADKASAQQAAFISYMAQGGVSSSFRCFLN